VTKRRTVKFIAGILALAMIAAACGDSDGDTTTTGGGDGAGELASIYFILDFIPKGYSAPFYYSLDQGYWAERGLAVTLTRGYGSGDTSVRIGRGEGDIGFAGVSAVMNTIAEGLPLVEFGPLLHTNPTTVFNLQPNGITTVEDLVGLDGATDLKSEQDALVRAYLAQQGEEYEAVNWLNMPEAGMPQVQTGEVDFVMDWIPNLPEWWQNDLEPDTTLWIGNSLEVYGNGFITRPDWLAENRDVAQRFLEGLYQGYLEVINGGLEAQEAAIDALFKYNPEVAEQPGAREFHLGNLQLMISLIVADEGVQEHGIGWWDPEKVDRTLTFINDYLLEEPLELEEAFISPDDQLTTEGQFAIEDVDAALEAVSVVMGRPNPLTERVGAE